MVSYCFKTYNFDSWREVTSLVWYSWFLPVLLKSCNCTQLPLVDPQDLIGWHFGKHLKTAPLVDHHQLMANYYFYTCFLLSKNLYFYKSWWRRVFCDQEAKKTLIWCTWYYSIRNLGWKSENQRINLQSL